MISKTFFRGHRWLAILPLDRFCVVYEIAEEDSALGVWCRQWAHFCLLPWKFHCQWNRLGCRPPLFYQKKLYIFIFKNKHIFINLGGDKMQR